jgi:type I restriction enzyme S subunit
MTTALPEGWATIRVGDYFNSWGGMTPSTRNASYWGGNVPWVSSKDIKAWRIAGGKEFITRKALRETRLRLCPVGSVLVVVRSGILAHTLPIAVVDSPVSINQDLKAFHSPDSNLNEWLALALRALAPEILTNNRKDGTTVQSVRYEELCDLIIPVPPSTEQRRITARLEELLQKVRDTRERLSRVPAILKCFRQAVLAAACSGRLTEAWRDEHANIESAVDLLRILESDVKRNRVTRQSSAANQLEEEPFELPPTWIWASVSEVCSSVTDGDHQPPPKAPTGVPFLVISNINTGKLDMGDTMFVPHEYYERISDDRKPRRGDILYSVTGSFGIPALVDSDTPFCFQRHIALLRPHPRISGSYLFRVVASDLVYRQASAVATGIAQLTVPLSGLRSLRIPVAPAEEQDEIARRVDKLFLLADRIERLLSAAALRSNKLTQSILAKAFRGELVTTEAELARREGRKYEPASVLLERIWAERENQVKSPQVSKHKSKKSATLVGA